MGGRPLSANEAIDGWGSVAAVRAEKVPFRMLHWNKVSRRPGCTAVLWVVTTGICES